MVIPNKAEWAKVSPKNDSLLQTTKHPKGPVTSAIPIPTNKALIKKISETLKCGILLISHNLHVVMSKTDHVVCLNGHVCCSGTPISVANNKKYQELFGEDVSKILSIYEHKHDHKHGVDGSVEEN